MEIKQVFLKTRAEFGKQCIFDICGPHLDEEIKPDPDAMAHYIIRSHCNVGVQHTKQFALHEAQTVGSQTKSSGMFHFEGGWPKEINPKDEEVTARFRRRVEKEEDWAPKLLNLFQEMEHNILQNGALNIYEHYFDDMIPTELVKPRGLRTVNVYEDPQTPVRSVNNISWSPDSGSKMVVSYCFFGIEPDYSNIAYIWQIDNPNKPWMAMEAPFATVVSEFNPRDPSILASGLMSGQVCSWDVRTGSTPVQMSHRQFSHRDCVTTVKWIATKSNTEFFSGSSDGRAMWWDTRKLREPTEVLVFDLQTPNEQKMDRAIGVSSSDYEPSVGTKFMFGLENGIVISGSRKSRTPAEKMALRFNAHYGPVLSVDRSGFNPKIFLTVGDRTVRVWAEDTKDSSLVSTRFIIEGPQCSCWNKTRHSIFYVATRVGVLAVWDLLIGLQEPILSVKLCEQKLTAVASHEMGSLLAVGNSAGNVYLVELTEALYSFDKNDRNDFTSYLERCSRFVKAIDTRMKEIKLARTTVEETPELALVDPRERKKDKRLINDRNKRKIEKEKLKEPRERIRIMSKRKPKDEFPELQEVEDQFFEIVKKEKQKYEEIEDLDILPSKVSRIIKRVVSRKIEKDSHLPIDEATGLETKIPPKKILFKEREKYPKKTETIEISKTEIAQDVEQEKAMAEEPLPLLAEEPLPPLVKVIVESPMQEISKRKRGKKARKKRPKHVIFRLAKPCKVVVCKPDICCRRTTFAIRKTRFTDRVVKGHEKWGDVDERMRSKDVIKVKSSIKDKIRRKKRECWTEFLRVHKCKELTRKYSTQEKIRFLQKMAPLEEFADMTEDVKKAKKEIQEANMARKLTKKALKSSTTAAEKSRDTPGGSGRGKEVTSMTKKILTARKARKVCRTVVMTDPCVPWKPPSLVEDLQTLFEGLPPKSIEEKTKSSVACMEEIEATHAKSASDSVEQCQYCPMQLGWAMLTRPSL
ncbi:PREDICTED: dynein intermediate chain 2, axonemal-like [Cyphomyrmex costatus]|uniref:dynein intermediate chain 2, axonemal-like n=1 Tax=Cyphomyrmex costatus TaxID=456900 RepID=UPI0008522258|nr:PREDICTED: dynein intermediate chain 2, axonemal-like [Cyphomyrmex costatus]